MRCILFALALVALTSAAAHAQRYDSSYGYEMRGFVPPPSPFVPERRTRPCPIDGPGAWSCDTGNRRRGDRRYR
jgi:hypothetical protein